MSIEKGLFNTKEEYWATMVIKIKVEAETESDVLLGNFNIYENTSDAMILDIKEVSIVTQE